MNGFTLSLLALVILSIAVPLWHAWRWRGAWRIAAATPAIVVSVVVLRIIIDTRRDPTSHNLWPFEILIFSGGAFAAIGVLSTARRALRRES